MSDTDPWASPGGGVPGGAPGGPGFGAPGGPGFGGPGGPGFGVPPGGWAPPPKPGLIPLRPLTLGDILGAAFRVFRRNPRTTFGTALLFQLVVFAISVAIVIFPAISAYNSIQGSLPQDQGAALASAFGGLGLAFIVPVFLQLAVGAILQGLFVIETSHQIVGEKMRLRGLLRQARGRIWALIGWSLLIVAAVFVGIIVFAVIVGILIAVGGRGGAVAAVLTGVLGGLGLVALAVWLGTKTALVPSILLLERMTLGRAIGRSWRLTRHSFWRTFGIIALVAVIIQVASSVVTTPVSFITQIGGGVFQPNGSSNESGEIVTVIVSTLITQFVTTLIQAVASVIRASTVALIYVDLRIRREGLDLDLLQYVELRSQGVQPLPQPYRTPEGPVMPYGGGPGWPGWPYPGGPGGPGGLYPGGQSFGGPGGPHPPAPRGGPGPQ